MNITIAQDALLFGLSTVGKASPSSSTLSILTGVLLDATQDNTLRLVATDLQIGIECVVEAKTTRKGAVVIPTKLISDLVKKLPAGELVLDSQGFEDGVNIKSGNSEFNIRTLPFEEFPSLPETDTGWSLNCPNTLLKNMIKMTAFAASSDEARPFLTGIYLNYEDGNLKSVATDASRLAFRQEPIASSTSETFGGVIVPSRAVSELARILPDNEDLTEISKSGTQISFKSSGIRLVSRLIEGQFPNYKAIIPRSYNTRIFIDRLQLLGAADRASLISRDKVSVIRMVNTPGSLVITSNSPDIGKGYEELEIEQSGDEMKIALDARYLIEALKTMESERVVIELQGSNNAVCLKEENGRDYIHLIMPVKVAS